MVLNHPNTSVWPATSIPTPSDHRLWATQFERLHIDLGTGDGKFAVHLARRNPTLGMIGIDACLDHVHGARRRHPGNVRFACIDVLAWPLEMIPAADAVTINFPYGSLLQ
jgi:tRNA G46 methylase TrmB